MGKRLYFYIVLLASCGILFYSYKSEHNELSGYDDIHSRVLLKSGVFSVYENDSRSRSDSLLISKPYFKNISCFIAGEQLAENSELYQYTKDTVWINYEKNLNSIWDKFYHQKLEYIGLWSKDKLANVNDQADIALYPFSGPDFLYMYKFLPNAKEYFLFGLEHVGTIPDIDKIKGPKMKFYLQSLNKSISTLIDVSYFITKRMMLELNNVKIDGVLPVILFFMAKSHVTVTDIKPAAIDSLGKITTTSLELNALIHTKFGRGVEITFISPQKKEQKLYYFSGDLQDLKFTSKSKIHKMISKLQGNIVTLFKSASYLLHGNNFSTMRKLVLDKSDFIIQDDTGIPYRSFAKGGWDLCFFGKYTPPIRCFSYCFQADLSKSFPKDAEALDFRFGYNKTSYILIASKIHPQKQVLLPKDLPSER